MRQSRLVLLFLIFVTFAPKGNASTVCETVTSDALQNMIGVHPNRWGKAGFWAFAASLEESLESVLGSNWVWVPGKDLRKYDSELALRFVPSKTFDAVKIELINHFSRRDLRKGVFLFNPSSK